MTGKDYRKALNEIKETEKSLDSRITQRLVELVGIHPDAIVAHKMDDDVKARSLTQNYIVTLPIEKRIEYIETIESYSNKEIQLEI